MTGPRAGRSALAALCAGALAVACNSSKTVPATGLELIIASDLPASDFDDVRLEVSELEPGGTWSRVWDRDYVVPSSEATLPATFAIGSGASPNEQALVTVTAYRGGLTGTPVVQRVAQVQLPTDRMAALWMVLARLCEGQVKTTGAEGEAVSTCGSGESCQPGNGQCGSNVIGDPASLPTYVPDQNLDAGIVRGLTLGDAGVPGVAPPGDDGQDATSARNDATTTDAQGDNAASDDGGQAANDSGMENTDASDAGTDAATNDAGDAGPTCPAPTDIDGGLLVYYPFEGDTNDRSGNGNNGSATTGTDLTYGPAKVGQGATILPAGRGIAVNGSTTLGPARTLCAWVNAATGTAGGGLPIVVAGATGAADLYDVATVSPNDNCGTQIKNTLLIDDWVAPCTRSTLAPAPGAWSFVCFAQSATSTTFFMNGATSSASTSAYPAALSAITVGSDRVGGSTTQVVFKGQLDEISIWSAPLSTADMNALYAGGSGCSLR